VDNYIPLEPKDKNAGYTLLTRVLLLSLSIRDLAGDFVKNLLDDGVVGVEAALVKAKKPTTKVITYYWRIPFYAWRT
jgi:hypothetical protein